MFNTEIKIAEEANRLAAERQERAAARAATKARKAAEATELAQMNELVLREGASSDAPAWAKAVIYRSGYASDCGDLISRMIISYSEDLETSEEELRKAAKTYHHIFGQKGKLNKRDRLRDQSACWFRYNSDANILNGHTTSFAKAPLGEELGVVDWSDVRFEVPFLRNTKNFPEATV